MRFDVGDEPFAFAYPIVVQWGDVDRMGHVNNANYLTYCEQARVAFLRHNDLGWQLPFILAEATVRFVFPAKFGDTVHVHLDVGHIGSKSWRFDYRLTDRIYFNMDLKKTWISADVKMAGQTISKVKVDPWLLGIGLGYRF